MQIPFGEWLPDLPDHLNPGATIASGVYPAANSYKPWKATNNISATALDSQCKGGISAKDVDSNSYTFAGTQTKLYQLDGTTLNNVSKSGNYTGGTDNMWDFTVFGNHVVAANGIDEPQVFTLGSSSLFADLGGSPPIFTYSNVIRDFLFTGRISTAKNRVQWSGINDIETWTSGTKQSDSQDLADGGEVTGITGGEYGYIFQENAITRVDYVGAPTIFRFSTISKNRGAVYAKSIVQVGSRVFFYAQDGFFEIAGDTIKAIGQHKVNANFQSDLDVGYQKNIVGANDPLNHLVIWSYPSDDATLGVNDTLLIYNYAVDRWSEVTASAPMIWTAFGQPYTVETLDTISTSLDSLTASFDSRFYLGGTLFMAGANDSHYIVDFTGNNLAATITTGEIEPIPNRRSTITRVTPLTDSAISSSTPTARIGSRARAGDSVSNTSYVALTTNGTVPLRSSGRYHRLSLNIAANTSWNHAQGMDAEIVSAGNR